MKIDTGSTAWMLASTALVLLMTPGLAFFYGGMTRAKSVLNMMMMSWVAIITVTMAWVLYGDSLAFGSGNGFIGGLEYLGEHGLMNDASRAAGIPDLVFSAFQLTFAVITVALISGAIADRAKFGAWAVFTVAWATLVYFPVAHWVWGGGWLSSLGIEDFAGGTVVHVNSGAAGLALALVLGKRRGFGKDPMRPHNVPLVLLGAGLLWFGWFGFNAGSELAADGTAALAFMNTQVATAAAAGGWLLVERFRDGKPTTVGIASGAVAGLVAITPACAYIAPWEAILLGLAAGVICCYAVGLKHRLGFDDALDVVGVHLAGGAFGALSLGLLAAYPLLDGQRKGLFFGGGLAQLGVQALGPVAVGLYSFTLAWIIAKVIDKTMGFRVPDEEEVNGVDIAQHAESAYDLGSVHPVHSVPSVQSVSPVLTSARAAAPASASDDGEGAEPASRSASVGSSSVSSTTSSIGLRWPAAWSNVNAEHSRCISAPMFRVNAGGYGEMRAGPRRGGGARMMYARLVAIARYASVLGGGLLTGGALTALVLELALRRLGGPAYIEVRQAEHAFFPWFIGAILVPTFAAVAMLVYFARRAGSPALRPAAAALILIVLALAVSFAVNVPINLEQIDWRAQAPPADWASVRDRWQIAHAVRTGLFVIALACLGAAVIGRPFEGAAGKRSRTRGRAAR